MGFFLPYPRTDSIGLLGILVFLREHSHGILSYFEDRQNHPLIEGNDENNTFQS